MVRGIFKFGVVFFFVLACKPKTESTVQSLDNYGADKSSFKLNKCNIENGLKVDAKYNDRFVAKNDNGSKAELIKLYSLVPTGLQKLFLEGYNGKIELVSNLPEACELDKTVSADGLMSCRGYSSDKKNVTIFILQGENLVKTQANIQHSLIRAHAYVLSELSAHVLTDKGDIDTFNNFAKEFAARYIKDAKSSESKDNLKFASEVLAEVIDSVKCSSESKAILEKKFPTVYLGDTNVKEPKSNEEYIRKINAENAVNEILAGLENPNSASNLVNDDSAPQGLSLWGPFGYGNGPLRATGRVIYRGASAVYNNRLNGGGFLNPRNAWGSGRVFGWRR